MATRDHELIAPEHLPPPAGSAWEREETQRWRLVRFDRDWRATIRSLTAERSLEVGVSTWQFITDTPYLAWRGSWQHRRAEMRGLEVWIDDQPVTSLDLPDALEESRLALFDGLPTVPHQVSIWFPATSTLALSTVEIAAGSSLSPGAARTRWCSWGDSITQGTLCPSVRDTYVQKVANRLGLTAINRGFGGAGYPDPATALAVAAGEPWDVLTIAIGVNSAFGGHETPAEFGLMYRACLRIVQQRCAGKPVLCISPVVCARELTADGEPMPGRLESIRREIEEAVSELACRDVGYVDGRTLLGDPSLLAPDQVHPTPDGHAEMGRRLAPVLGQAMVAAQNEAFAGISGRMAER